MNQAKGYSERSLRQLFIWVNELRDEHYFYLETAAVYHARIKC